MYIFIFWKHTGIMKGGGEGLQDSSLMFYIDHSTYGHCLTETIITKLFFGASGVQNTGSDDKQFL